MSKRKLGTIGCLPVVLISVMLVSCGTEKSSEAEENETKAVESVETVEQEAASANNSVEVTVMSDVETDVEASADEFFKDIDTTIIDNSERTIGYQADMEYAVYESINELRTEAGLEPLRWDGGEMYDYAVRRSVEIIDDFSHDSIGGDMDFAENIAEGYDNVPEVMDAWMNSPGHRANIMCDYYKSVSVSVYYNGHSYYWVQNFNVY